MNLNKLSTLASWLTNPPPQITYEPLLVANKNIPSTSGDDTTNGSLSTEINKWEIQGKWLRLAKATFVDTSGIPRSWEVCQRCHHAPPPPPPPSHQQQQQPTVLDISSSDSRLNGDGAAADPTNGLVSPTENMRAHYALMKGRCEAVDIIATMKGGVNANEMTESHDDVHVVLVVQFRPPVHAYVVEFPSGDIYFFPE
jgi:hypothetical protein